MAISNWALVTGASSGIGKELAIKFAEDKRNVVLTARNESALHELAKHLRDKYGVEVQILATDLSKLVEAEKLINWLKEENISIGYLVNNAGFGDYTKFAESDWNRQLDMIQLNITSLTFLTRMLLPDMIDRKAGMIMNIASTAAFIPGPYMAVYFATKAFVLHFGEAIQQELLGTGVSLTTLCPGPTESNFAQAAQADSSNLFKGKKMPSSKSVAEYGYDKMMKRKGTKIYGWGNFLLANSTRLFPRNLVAKMTAKVLSMK